MILDILAVQYNLLSGPVPASKSRPIFAGNAKLPSPLMHFSNPPSRF